MKYGIMVITLDFGSSNLCSIHGTSTNFYSSKLFCIFEL